MTQERRQKLPGLRVGDWKLRGISEIGLIGIGAMAFGFCAFCTHRIHAFGCTHHRFGDELHGASLVFAKVMLISSSPPLQRERLLWFAADVCQHGADTDTSSIFHACKLQGVA